MAPVLKELREVKGLSQEDVYNDTNIKDVPIMLLEESIAIYPA